MAQLRRELGAGEAMALSVALMAPTLSASLNGSGIAAIAGVGVPLVMVLTTVGIALIALAFVRLTRTYNHAGSVYALTGITLGPRFGFFSGFALLGVYLAFSGSTLTGVNVFAQAFCDGIGLSADAGWVWVVVSVLACGIGLLLACGDVRFVARSLLIIEGVSIVLIVVLSTIVLARVGASGHALTTKHQSLSLTPFTGGHAAVGSLAAASVLGFFSFAGFEASASLGEETTRPRKYIPLALAMSVLVGGLLLIYATYAQSIGFGTGAAGVHS
jgi:amino acid transporter